MDTPDFVEVEEAILKFASLGLTVMITELDIGVLPAQYQGTDISMDVVLTPKEQAVMNAYVDHLPEEWPGSTLNVIRRHSSCSCAIQISLGVSPCGAPMMAVLGSMTSRFAGEPITPSSLTGSDGRSLRFS